MDIESAKEMAGKYFMALAKAVDIKSLLVKFTSDFDKAISPEICEGVAREIGNEWPLNALQQALLQNAIGNLFLYTGTQIVEGAITSLMEVERQIKELRGEDADGDSKGPVLH